MEKALLLSNSVTSGSSYLQWCSDIIRDFFKTKKNIVFIPYAAVTVSYDEYEEKVIKALKFKNNELKSIHNFPDKIKALNECDAVLTGGGNTFALKYRLEQEKIFTTLQTVIKKENVLYCGWSAGANIAGLSIKTTNDMPIIEPESFEGLKVADFQINPHYTDKTIENHNGESRDERLLEFSYLNPDVCCAAIPEAGGLIVEDNPGKFLYFGQNPGKIFYRKKMVLKLQNGDRLNFHEHPFI
jgi:dipeptidase E